MIKTILFATDLGAFTSHSLLHVESLARQFNAQVSIVHAVPPIGEFAAAVVRSHCSDQVKKEVLQTSHIKGLLEAMREQIFEVLARDPGGEAGLLGSDLIVVGSHSAEALDGRLLGSVATKVLQLAKVPVFMVPMMNPDYGVWHGNVNTGFRA
jgi:nucleotide-binding universal stress UspA family protein